MELELRMLVMEASGVWRLCLIWGASLEWGLVAPLTEFKLPEI